MIPWAARAVSPAQARLLPQPAAGSPPTPAAPAPLPPAGAPPQPGRPPAAEQPGRQGCGQSRAAAHVKQRTPQLQLRAHPQPRTFSARALPTLMSFSRFCSCRVSPCGVQVRAAAGGVARCAMQALPPPPAAVALHAPAYLYQIPGQVLRHILSGNVHAAELVVAGRRADPLQLVGPPPHSLQRLRSGHGEGARDGGPCVQSCQRLASAHAPCWPHHCPRSRLTPCSSTSGSSPASLLPSGKCFLSQKSSLARGAENLRARRMQAGGGHFNGSEQAAPLAAVTAGRHAPAMQGCRRQSTRLIRTGGRGGERGSGQGCGAEAGRARSPAQGHTPTLTRRQTRLLCARGSGPALPHRSPACRRTSDRRLAQPGWRLARGARRPARAGCTAGRQQAMGRQPAGKPAACRRQQRLTGR